MLSDMDKDIKTILTIVFGIIIAITFGIVSTISCTLDEQNREIKDEFNKTRLEIKESNRRLDSVEKSLNGIEDDIEEIK